MAGSFSNYLENAILNHIFGKSAYIVPTIYIALSTADPGEDGSGLSEPSGNNYARVATAPEDWAEASGGSISNASEVEFPAATGSWGFVTHFALMDASTGGNMLCYGQLDVGRAVEVGNIPRFAIDALVVSMD